TRRRGCPRKGSSRARVGTMCRCRGGVLTVGLGRKISRWSRFELAPLVPIASLGAGAVIVLEPFDGPPWILPWGLRGRRPRRTRPATGPYDGDRAAAAAP